jgi:hypothetical protein
MDSERHVADKQRGVNAPRLKPRQHMMIQEVRTTGEFIAAIETATFNP